MSNKGSNSQITEKQITCCKIVRCAFLSENITKLTLA